MSRYRAEETDSSFLGDVFKIALGVFIGGLLAALAYTKIIAMEAEYALRQVNASLQKEAKARAERDRQQVEAQRLQHEAQEKARVYELQQQAMLREQEAAAQREQQERNARKEAAFKRYYQPSRLCEIDPLTVPCINAGMVARRRFDEQYKD